VERAFGTPVLTTDNRCFCLDKGAHRRDRLRLLGVRGLTDFHIHFREAAVDLEQVLAAAAPEAFGRSCEHENARKPRRMRMRDFPVVFVHQIAKQPQSSIEKSDGVLEVDRALKRGAGLSYRIEMEHETDLVRFVLLRLRHLMLVEALVAEPPGLVAEPDVDYLVAHIEAVGEIGESRRAPYLALSKREL
jgi:hypothetical protein